MFPIVVLGVVEEGFDSRLGEGPGAGIEGLLLGPDDGLGIGVAIKILLQLLPWERVELLDTRNGGILETVVGTVLVESSVDLTCAENYTFDLLRLVNADAVFGIGNDPFKL